MINITNLMKFGFKLHFLENHYKKVRSADNLLEGDLRRAEGGTSAETGHEGVIKLSVI